MEHSKAWSTAKPNPFEWRVVRFQPGLKALYARHGTNEAFLNGAR